MLAESSSTSSTPSPVTEDDAPSGGAPSGLAHGGHAPTLARFYMTSDLRAATGLTRTHLDFYLREGVVVPTA